MKVKQCGDLGTIEYRMPNVPEAMRLLSSIGLNSKKLASGEAMDDDLGFIAGLIESLGAFITKVNLDIDGEKITSYEDVLKEFSMMVYLTEISGEILEQLQLDSKKKAPRKKR